MDFENDLRTGWMRDSGERVEVRMYGDDTVTVAVYGDEATMDTDEAMNLSRSVWSRAYSEARETTDDQFELDEPSMSNETVTVTIVGDDVVFESSLVSETISLTTDELDRVLDHARSARKALEYDGLI